MLNISKCWFSWGVGKTPWKKRNLVDRNVAENFLQLGKQLLNPFLPSNLSRQSRRFAPHQTNQKLPWFLQISEKIITSFNAKKKLNSSYRLRRLRVWLFRAWSPPPPTDFETFGVKMFLSTFWVTSKNSFRSEESKLAELRRFSFPINQSIKHWLTRYWLSIYIYMKSFDWLIDWLIDRKWESSELREFDFSGRKSFLLVTQNVERNILIWKVLKSVGRRGIRLKITACSIL